MSDKQIRDAIDGVFKSYDKDGSNSLDSNEVYDLLKDGLLQMSSSKNVSKAEVDQFIAAVDKSGDGKIQKA